MPAPHLEWLDELGLGGLPRRQLSGGYRNAAWSLGDRFVLKVGGRPAVEAALARLLPGIAPEVIAVTNGASVSTFVPGVSAEVLLSRLGPADARELGVAAGRTLARIGEIHFTGPGWFLDHELRLGGMPGDLAVFVAACLARLHPGWRLTEAEVRGLLVRARERAPLVPDGEARLVHSDFNPKNLLAARTGDGWRVTVLDWEFAHSGSPLTDLGNVLRFGDTPFTDGVVEGFGPRPEGWREAARALDLFALADFLTRPPQEPLASRLLGVIRTAAATPGPARRSSGDRSGRG
ncbi:phosphotransferase family protein [Amycolatopsis thermophila]|uniref:Ser/Thr protein kinase RdoA (MazF antagonist) n=1 Tax=Amycolatopsis thermophila TaxID=206084 RepID=A0ABU0EX39_9PSEU|nr:phosphotransferase [Amycolatopsis thermophila]MDQ0379673.1 Ser/Thr protein kinase RdoA (MazF antagonist) [Amycolatopsis thermophila]